MLRTILLLHAVVKKSKYCHVLIETAAKIMLK